MAAYRLGDGSVAAVPAIGAVLAEAAEGSVDYVGFYLLEFVVAESEALHGAWGEVLDDYVGFF